MGTGKSEVRRVRGYWATGAAVGAAFSASRTPANPYTTEAIRTADDDLFRFLKDNDYRL